MEPTLHDWLTWSKQPDVAAVSPFSNGTEQVDWYGSNCDKCYRSLERREPPPRNGYVQSDYESALFQNRECGAKFCIDMAMVTERVHTRVVQWMGGKSSRIPSRCKRRITNPDWKPDEVSVAAKNQIKIPFREEYPLLELAGLVITKQGIFEESDLCPKKAT